MSNGGNRAPDDFTSASMMMVAAVDAVHEGDEIGGAVGQAQAEIALVEFHRGRHIVGEGEHMREPARAHRRRAWRAMAAPATPPGEVTHWLSDLWSGETLGATLTSISTPSGLRNQKPLLSKPGGGSISLTPLPSMRALSRGRSSA